MLNFNGFQGYLGPEGRTERSSLFAHKRNLSIWILLSSFGRPLQNETTERTASRDLSDLVEKGIIKSSGVKGAGAFYTLT